MKMKDFAEIVKKSHLAGNNKKKIIYLLLQALGAKDACGESARGRSDQEQSPSDSTIQKWLSDSSNKPGVSRYFPSLKVENENKESAQKFLRRTSKEDQWKELRDLFKKWREENPDDEEFCVKTETDDFDAFSTSFWWQFTKFFDSLDLWDGAKDDAEDSRIKTHDSIIDEMIGIFKESFMQYRVYEFIPKEINNIFDSLHVYGNVSACDSKQKFKKMYCKWFPNYEHFVFCEAIYRNCRWELRIPGECIFLKFDESFDYDMTPTNTWITGRIKYAFASPDLLEGAQVDDETDLWKECQGKIIIVAIDLSVDEENPFIEDCYVLIDGMLEQGFAVDEFIAVINEKILKKYGDVLSDYDSRRLYNDIKQYRKLLKRFKKNLDKFRNLQKKKSEYLSDQAFIKTFGMYSSFSDFEASPKPAFPFSEVYLDPDEADKVISCLRRCHENLIELYAVIFSYEENHTV